MARHLAAVHDLGVYDDVTRQFLAHEMGRAVLYLSPKGTAKWELHDDPQDIYIARSALALLTARYESGLLTYTDPEIPDDDALISHDTNGGTHDDSDPTA